MSLAYSAPQQHEEDSGFALAVVAAGSEVFAMKRSAHSHLRKRNINENRHDDAPMGLETRSRQQESKRASKGKAVRSVKEVDFYRERYRAALGASAATSSSNRCDVFSIACLADGQMLFRCR